MPDLDQDEEDRELARISDEEAPLKFSDAEAREALIRLMSGQPLSHDERETVGNWQVDRYNPVVLAAMTTPACVEHARQLAKDYVAKGGGFLQRKMFTTAAELLDGQPVPYFTDSDSHFHSGWGPSPGMSMSSSDSLTFHDATTRDPVAAIEQSDIPSLLGQQWCLIWGELTGGSVIVLANTLIRNPEENVLVAKIKHFKPR